MSRLFYSLLKEEPARVRFRNAYRDQLINRANLNVKGFDQRVKVFHFNIQDRYLSINDRKNTDKQFKKESGEYILPSMDDTYWIKVKREIELAHKYLKSDPDKFKNQILPVLQGKTRDEATKIFFNTVQPKSSVDTYERIRSKINGQPKKWQDLVLEQLKNNLTLNQSKLQLPNILQEEHLHHHNDL